MPEEPSGYVCTVYHGRGLPPEKQEFEDLAKAEKAFNDAKAAAILWAVRSVNDGVGWVKLKDKQAPASAPAAPVQP